MTPSSISRRSGILEAAATSRSAERLGLQGVGLGGFHKRTSAHRIAQHQISHRNRLSYSCFRIALKGQLHPIPMIGIQLGGSLAGKLSSEATSTQS
jgi:hypothetical protein